MYNYNSVIACRQITDSYSAVSAVVNQFGRNFLHVMFIQYLYCIIACIVFDAIADYNIGCVVCHVCNRTYCDTGRCTVNCEISSAFTFSYIGISVVNNNYPVIAGIQIADSDNTVSAVVNQFVRNFGQAVIVKQFDCIIPCVVYNAIVNHNIGCVVGDICNRIDNDR